MEFSQPPPDIASMNFSIPPPASSQSSTPRSSQSHNNLITTDTSGPPPPSTTGGGAGAGGVSHHGGGGRHHSHYGGGGGGGGGGHHYHHGAGKPGHPYFKPFINFGRGPGGIPMTQDDFDGKRLRKSVMRKTVDYNASIVKALENRVWQRDHRDRHALQPESIYIPELLPPPSYMDNPSNAVTTKFVKTATNKMRCPIFTLAWTPEGRRLVTGASSGEFTLWNGLTFNFETILQAHDVPVRTMVWSHNDSWMVTGDHAGYVKYWQSNMNNVKMFQAHKEPIRGISFSPTDSKFVSCSDDGTLRVWDFLRCQEERVLRGHGADVKCVHWHPQKALIVSGSKDNQQPIKLWDPKSGQALATLHAHKSTVMDLKWNDNGNWLVTASRDHLLKLFDLRNLREEVQVFRGHKKEASSVTWHPVHEGLFCSGGSDGSVLFWNVGTDKEIGGIDTAHDSIVWTLAWHPLGHILCSGSNDHTIKFWTRNRPGDQMRDKYNLNTLPASLAGLDECDIDDNLVIPGMGPEDKVEFTESLTADTGFIPGLELDTSNIEVKNEKKVPYSKPIPRNFQAQWNDTGRNEDAEENASKEIKEVITQIVENTPGVVPLEKIAPTAIIVYGKVIPVIPGGKLQAAILAGPNALNKFISSGQIEELNDVMPFDEPRTNSRNSDSGKSPPVKKSRFSDAPRDHNAQMIYDTDLRQLEQHQQLLQQQQQQPFIPPLLALKVPQPNEFGTGQDQDFRSFNNTNFNDNDERQQQINPWASGTGPSQNGGFMGSGSTGNNFINNSNFHSGDDDDYNSNHNFNGKGGSGGGGGGSSREQRGRTSRFNDNTDNFRGSGSSGGGDGSNNRRGGGGGGNQDFRRGNNNSSNSRNQNRNRNKNRRF